MAAAVRRGAPELATLKGAEEEAAKMIAAARDEKRVLMRKAQAEAAKEIEEYRAARESKLRTATSEGDVLVARVRRTIAETEGRLRVLDDEYARNKDGVIGVMLQIVLNIENTYATKA